MVGSEKTAIGRQRRGLQQTIGVGELYSVLSKLGREFRPDQNRVVFQTSRVKCETNSCERDVVQGRETIGISQQGN
jgi:hypothetical protein